MSELTPITRIETYLDAIVNGGTPPLDDVTRIETFLDAIYNNQVCALTPVTRIEMFLGKISGQSIDLPEPVTRIELYLAAIAGEDVVLPDEPVTRIEMYLAEWAEGSNIPWETLSGAIVSFIAPRSHALKEVVVGINPVQSGSGDPSPDNVRPISGWTEANVQRTGKNVLDTSGILPASIKWANFAAFPIDQKVFQRATEENITIKLLGSLGTGKTQFALYIYDTVNNNAFYVGHSQNLTEDNNYTLTGLVTVGGSGIDITKPLTLRIYAQPYTGDEASEITGVMISFGTDTDYHAYQGNTYAIDWTDEAGTVYGGTLTVDEDGSGSVEVTHRTAKVKDLSWTYGVATHTYYYSAAPDGKKGIQTDIYCDTYKTTDLGPPSAPMYSISLGQPYISSGYCGVAVKDDRFSGDASAFRTAMGETQFAYELATPVTFSLSPQQVITALQGLNNVWANTGDVTVTFRGTPVVEPDEQPLQALNLLLGGTYRNNQTPDDVSDEEALDILLGGADR